VKNGIILRLHLPPQQTAASRSSPRCWRLERVRLRPILMTTLCPLFGLLPLALASGPAAKMQRPLAWRSLADWPLSTPITLFLVPTFLVAVRGRDYSLAPTGAARPSTAGAVPGLGTHQRGRYDTLQSSRRGVGCTRRDHPVRVRPRRAGEDRHAGEDARGQSTRPRPTQGGAKVAEPRRAPPALAKVPGVR